MRTLTLAAVAMLMLAITSNAQKIGEMKPVDRDGIWELREGKDNFTDKSSCVILPPKQPNIQISDNSMYVSYRGRGGLKGYTLRVDDDPPGQMQLPSPIERDTAAITFMGECLFARF
jgi:hypothetical protein